MKAAIITGGNKGLGLAQTQLFLAKGYRVYVVARSRGDLDDVSGDIHFVEADLNAGKIDVLVNNAGMHLKKPVWEVSENEFDQVIGLNVKAMFLACGRYIHLQRNQGGSIVNISSMGGLLALPSSAAYVTAKTAVIGLTRSICIDAAPFAIRCNAVAPGFIDTDMTRTILKKDPQRRAKIEGRLPGGTFGKPEDIADAVYFLSSSSAAHISGVVLPVDGGFSVGF